MARNLAALASQSRQCPAKVQEPSIQQLATVQCEVKSESCDSDHPHMVVGQAYHSPPSSCPGLVPGSHAPMYEALIPPQMQVEGVIKGLLDAVCGPKLQQACSEGADRATPAKLSPPTPRAPAAANSTSQLGLEMRLRQPAGGSERLTGATVGPLLGLVGGCVGGSVSAGTGKGTTGQG